jgi:hypothetical protein
VFRNDARASPPDRHTDDHFDESVAERYDEATAELSEPAVVEPIVDFLAEIAAGGAALSRIALPWHNAMSARARRRPLGGDGRATPR